MAAITITEAVNHPATAAWFRFNPIAPYAECGNTVVYLAQGMDNSFRNVPARALASSLSAYGIPKPGSLTKAPEQAKYGAIALDYDAEPIPQSTDACYIIVGFRTPIPRANGGGPAMFVLTDDTVLVEETTSLHPKKKTPLIVTYTDPSDKNNTTTKLATFRYTRPIRKLVISGYVVDKDMDDVRAAINTVNIIPWFGLPRAYWKFEEFRDEGTLLGNIFKVTCGFTTRITEDWSEYEVFYNETLGEYVEVKQTDIDQLIKTPYLYDQINANGITKTGLQDLANFATIFGIGDEGSSSISPTLPGQ